MDNIDADTIRWAKRNLGLATIIEESSLQLRAGGLTHSLVDHYAARMKAGDRFPPVSVGRIGRGYYLIDGFHRVAAARKAGLSEVAALVANVSADDASRLAFRANLDHGKRLTNADKRNRVGAFIERGLHLRPDGRVKSPYAVSEELGGVPTARSIYNYYKAAGISPDETEEDEERVPWRPDDPSRAELFDDLREQLNAVRALCERLEEPTALSEVARELRRQLKWVNGEISRLRHDTLEI